MSWHGTDSYARTGDGSVLQPSSCASWDVMQIWLTIDSVHDSPVNEGHPHAPSAGAEAADEERTGLVPDLAGVQQVRFAPPHYLRQSPCDTLAERSGRGWLGCTKIRLCDAQGGRWRRSAWPSCRAIPDLTYVPPKIRGIVSHSPNPAQHEYASCCRTKVLQGSFCAHIYPTNVVAQQTCC